MRQRTVLNKKTDFKDIFITGNPPFGQLLIEELIDYFRNFIGDKMIAYSVSESNIYDSQIGINKSFKLTVQELEQFIGILVVIPIVKTPSKRDYWE